MTSQGHPYARFRHALATGNARIAEAAARDLHHVGLADVLELALPYRDDLERHERGGAVDRSARRRTTAAPIVQGIAATYTVASPTTINASVPPGAATGKITVRTAGGSATSTTNFAILTNGLTTGHHR